MATLFSDDFGDASIGAAWTQRRGTWAESSGTIGISTPNAGPNTIEADTDAHAAVADVKVTVTQKSATGDGGCGGRFSWGSPVSSDSSNNSRFYTVDVFTNLCDTARYDVGVGAVLLRTGSITQVANGVLRLEISGSGATVTVKQFYQGVQIGADVADSAAERVTAAGQTGIMDWAGAVNSYDDFLVEDMAAPPDPEPGVIEFNRNTG